MVNLDKLLKKLTILPHKNLTTKDFFVEAYRLTVGFIGCIMVAKFLNIIFSYMNLMEYDKVMLFDLT